MFGRVGRPGAPAEKPKNAKETVKRIWQYMGRQRLPLVMAIVLVIITTLLSLFGPYMIGIIIDEHIIPRDVEGTIRMALILCAIYVVTALLSWLQTFIMVNVALRTIKTIRQDAFEKLHTLSVRFFDQRPHGELMSRVTNDIDSLNNALSQSVLQVISSLLTFVGVIIAMVSLNITLAAVSLFVVPLMVFATKRIIQHSSSSFVKRQRDLGELNGFVEEAINGAEISTLYSKEKDMVEKFRTINEELRQSSMRADTFSSFIPPTMNFLNNVGIGLVVGVGAFMVLNEWATVGIVAAFMNYSRQFARPLSQFAVLLNTIQSAVAGGERVFEILDEVPELKDKKGAIEVDMFKGEVEFNRVNFGYSEEKQILKNIHLHAKQGDTVALVGHTGSGKTTIINLLTRFYDVSNGEISIDGRNIKDYKIHNLRSKIGVVLQDTYLFSGTIMDNIRYGRLDATDEEVIAAAKTAWAHSFIKHLPDKYYTEIASEGTNLSQGQRQLIAISRAILANTDILILDEATSNIDTRTELHIQRGLNNLMKGKTSFVIAHRLKTIENADQILVIDGGEVIERGNHDTLMDSRGYYYGLYTSQFGI
ncbi:ABC transporter ATP-binding protein [Priestia taiwanensis]|nr:ABC transporter ATP-binding protein [Priestia taiwanensis]